MTLILIIRERTGYRMGIQRNLMAAFETCVYTGCASSLLEEIQPCCSIAAIVVTERMHLTLRPSSWAVTRENIMIVELGGYVRAVVEND